MKYRVYAREVHIQVYNVEAETPRQAVDAFNNGESEAELGPMEYSHIDGITHVEDEDGDVVWNEDVEEEPCHAHGDLDCSDCHHCEDCKEFRPDVIDDGLCWFCRRARMITALVADNLKGAL